MEVEIEFESDHFFSNDLCNQITITIDVYTTDGSDLDWDLVSIYDNTSDRFRKLNQFPEDEQERMQELCQRAAENEAPQVFDAYQYGSENDYDEDVY